MNAKVIIVFAAMVAFTQARLLGKCYDTHGCATCAGYTWCEELQQCLRWWEAPCELYINESDVAIMDYMIGNNQI